MTYFLSLYSAMDFFSITLTLFLLQDPIGNIPIFLSLLRTVAKSRHSWIIIRKNLIAFLVLTIFLLGGQSILKFLHISEQALGIAGGFILFTVAFKMIFPSESTVQPSIEKEEPLIVPLAIPLLAGPSTITAIILFINQHPDQIVSCFLSLALVTLFSTIILLLAIP